MIAAKSLMTRVPKLACMAASLFLLASCTLMTPNQSTDLSRSVNQTRNDLAELKAKQNEEFSKIQYTLNQINEKLAQQDELVKSKFEDVESQIGRVKQVGAAAAAPGSGAATPPSPPPVEATPAGPDPAVVLDSAKAALAQGKTDGAALDEAISIASKFVIDYPTSPLVPEANYILGSAYYQKNDFEKSRQSFDQITTQFPASPLMPKALHSRALAEIKLSQLAAARTDLERLRKDFPAYSPEAIEKLLRSLP